MNHPQWIIKIAFLLANVPASSIIMAIIIRNVNNAVLLGLPSLVLSNERAINELFVKSMEVHDL